MKLTVRWYGKLADVFFQDHSATIYVSSLNQAERSALAEHLREIADELTNTH